MSPTSAAVSRPPRTETAPDPPRLTPSEGLRLLLRDAEEFAVLLLHRNGRILFSNAGAERLLGFKNTELIGQDFSVLFTPEDYQQGLRDQDLVRARDEGRSQQIAWHVRQDGGRVLADVVIRPLVRENTCLGYSVILRDVTDEHAANQALRSRIAELEELHKQKDAFLAMVSHELRNPLGGIVNALELIRLDATTNPMQLRAREIMDRQTRRLEKLVEDLLEGSRTAAGKLELSRQRIDARLIIDRAVETCRALLDTRRHELQIAVPDQPLLLEADPSRLEQVVVNLLTNAAKYTPEGGRIEVTLTQERESAVLRVRDTGMGIAPELITKIFDLFTQAHHDSNGGLGVGLAVVRSLVELHGGTVEASSPGIGRGSEFVVRLPLCVARAG